MTAGPREPWEHGPPPGMFDDDTHDTGSDNGSPDAASGGAGPTWPEPLAADAFHGLAGEIVRAIEPHTEADPAALLVQFLTAFGNAAGNQPHYVADGARHACKLFVVILGATSKGRKGTSWARTLEPFALTDDEWTKRVVSGLSSGEGLIWQIRDPIYKKERNPRTKEIEDVMVDEGVDDKRVLVFEPELASTIAVMARQGSTLSSILRDAWDRSELRALTKNSPAQSTGAHVSIVGHVTRDELRRSLDRTELGNGFANRFLWACAKRARILPFGGGDLDLRPFAARLRAALDVARTLGAITLAADARPIWEDVYPELSEGRPGILGAVTARGEGQVVRVASIYALLDGCHQIGAAHLRAALAVWAYSAASARWVWGDALGDPVADELLAMLRANADGLTETEIRDAFGRHKSDQLSRAKNVLLTNGLLRIAGVNGGTIGEALDRYPPGDQSDQSDRRGRPMKLRSLPSLPSQSVTHAPDSEDEQPGAPQRSLGCERPPDVEQRVNVPARIVVEVRGLVAPNPLNRRMHWGTKARIARSHRAAVTDALAAVSLPSGPWRVTLVRIAPRALDRHDALPASLKHVADAVCGALHVDDGSPRMSIGYGQRRGTCAVEITIEHIEGMS